MSYRQIPQVKGSRFKGAADLFAQNEPEFLREAALEHGPLTHFKIFNLDFFLVADPQLIREILVKRQKEFPKSKRDVDILSSFIGNGLVTSGGAFHAKQRKLAQPAFHANRIGSYGTTMVDYTKAVMANWQDGQQLDMSQAMYELTMYIVAKTLFNTDMDEMREQAGSVGEAIHHLQQVSNEDFKSAIIWPDWIPTKRNRTRNAARKVLNATVEQIIDNRRSQAVAGQVPDVGDLLSMLMLSQYDDGSYMDDRQVLDEVLTLFVAGHETTSNALTWTWYLLAQHPEIAARVAAEVDMVVGPRDATLSDLRALPFTEKVIKEAMRLYPPAWVLNTRTTLGQTELGDYQLPAKALIFISPYAMHRLPQYFPHPEKFDPDRWTPEFEKELPRYAYLPFGGGPRVCIGNSFAMMEAQLVLATMIQRFTAKLATDKVELNAQVTLSALGGMPVTLHQRKSMEADESVGEELQAA